MRAKFLALAALVLGLASCQTDTVNGVKVDANGEAPVTIQVGLPEETATRAAGADSGIGAIGNIDLESTYDIRYILGVYDEHDELAKRIEKFEDKSTSTTFDLRLVPGRHYRFVVWADFVTEETESALHYDASDLEDIKLIKNMGDNQPMDESRDAYTGVFNTADNNGDVFSSKTNVDMTLTRPFAKLRIVSNDMKELYSDLVSARVTYSVPLYTSFNALTATPDEPENNVVKKVDFSTMVYENEAYPRVNGEQTLYADYLFGAEGSMVHFALDVVDGVTEIPTINFNTNIPVERNHLTTIYGPVLTDANNVTVEIKSDFAGEYTENKDVNTTASFAAALKDAEDSIEATIELTDDVVWATGAGIGSTPWIPEGAKTQKLTVNANGHKITATGSGVGAIRMANGGTLVINNAIIKDESVSYAENSWEYGYLEFAGNLEFNNCEFVNAIMVEDGDATFTKCVFNSNKESEYDVWVTGNKAQFKNCDVNGYRGIKIHEAYGSEVEKVVINKCRFNDLSKKPGVAMGDLNAGTKVVIKNSTFTNCQAGDQGLYIYETDTDVTTFNFIEENNTIVYATDSNDAFNEAIVDGMSYISLGDGEFNAPAGLSNGQADNTLTIVGNGIDKTTVKGATNTNNMHPGNYAHGLDLVLENLTFVTTNNGYNGGFGHAKSVTFRNCKIVGQFYAHSGAPHYFYDCIIDPLTGYLYTYASDCVFEGCTFSASEGKALQIYEDSATGENTVTIEDCAFVAAKQATTWDGKPVTGIDINSNGAKFEVYINNCTTTGFPTGLNSNSDLWNVKDAGKAHANVYVDGVQVWFAGYDVVANGLFKKENAYLVMTGEGLVELSGMTIKGGEIVTLGADIDLAGVQFNGLNAFNSENNNTFDGQNYTVSNWTYEGGAADMGFIRNWVGPIKNVKFENCHLKTNGRSAIAAAKVYGNIENVTINNCSIEDSYWACGLVAGLYNAGSVSNVTVTNSSVKSNGGTAAIVGVFNESAGERGLKNCSVSNTTINNTGAYGEAYSGGALVGMFNSGATFTIEGCTVSNNTLVGGYVYEKYPADESVTIIEK